MQCKPAKLFFVFLAFHSFEIVQFFPLTCHVIFLFFKELSSNLRLFTRKVNHLFSRFQTKV